MKIIINKSMESQNQTQKLTLQQREIQENSLKIENEERETRDYEKIKINLEGGISQELVTEKHSSLSAELICSICLEIVREPKFCGDCQHIFCKDCISKQQAKSKFCPNRCLYKDQDVNLIFKKLLFKIEFKCIYYKVGCTKIILYEDFDKHINNCVWGTYKCSSPGCLEKSNLRDMKNHVEVCPLKLVLCAFCSKEILKKYYADHFDECSNKEVVCEYCRKKVTNKEYLRHIDTCDEFEIKCDQCLRILKRKELVSHTEIVCLKFQVLHWKNKFDTSEKEKTILSQKLKASQNQMLDKLVNNNNNNNSISNLNSTHNNNISNMFSNIGIGSNSNISNNSLNLINRLFAVNGKLSY